MVGLGSGGPTPRDPNARPGAVRVCCLCRLYRYRLKPVVLKDGRCSNCSARRHGCSSLVGRPKQSGFASRTARPHCLGSIAAYTLATLQAASPLVGLDSTLDHRLDLGFRLDGCGGILSTTACATEASALTTAPEETSAASTAFISSARLAAIIGRRWSQRNISSSRGPS